MTIFVDTNVLVYARDANQPAKQPAAKAWMEHLWGTGTGRLSTQVLSEFYVTVTAKLHPGMPRAEARADVSDLMAWRPVAVTADLIADAWAMQDRYQLSYWDSLIVAAAKQAGSDLLLTEDLQDGQDLDGVIVVNPFRHPPTQPLL